MQAIKYKNERFFYFMMILPSGWTMVEHTDHRFVPRG